MDLAPDITLQARLRRWAEYLVITAIAIALLVLIGWQFDIFLLRRPLPRLVAMNPLTAVLFFCASFSFLLLRYSSYKQKNRWGVVLAVLVILASLLKLSDVLLHTKIGIDQVLFRHKLVQDLVYGLPNRMAPNTAIGFLLSGIALLVFGKENKKGGELSQYIALLLLLVALLSILGYVYQVDSFYGITVYIPMAFHTAVCFLLLAVAFLFAQPEGQVMKELTSSMSGSIMARILIPAAVIVPSVLGLLRLQGDWSGIYDSEFGVALYALCIIIIFLGLTWYNAHLLNRRDILKMNTEKVLRDSEEQIRAIFENAPDAVFVIDKEGKIIKWNPAAEKLFGWKAAEVIDKFFHEIFLLPQYRHLYQTGLHSYLRSGQSNLLDQTLELPALRKEESEVDIALRVSPMILDDKYFFVGFVRDITEQKKMQTRLESFNEELAQQVRDKTRELSDMFERITDGFISLDKNFCYNYINKKAGELIRHDPTSLLGKNVWEVFPDAVGSNTYKAFLRAMETQEYVINTDYYEPLDLWQENHIYPSQEGLSVFIKDITEAKRAEKEISEARNLADTLIDSLPGVFYFYDENGRFIRWNREFENVTGYSGAEIAEMHPSDFFPDDEKEYITGRIKTVFEEGINDAEADFLTKDGRRIPYYFKALLLQYKGKPCLLGSGIDITKRKKVEDELRVSEQKYKLLFESNPLPMWMLSLPDYRFTDVNNATLKQYGYTKEEFLKLSVLDIRPEEERKVFNQRTDKTFRGVHRAGIWRHLKKDGSIIYVDIITHDFMYKEQPTRLVLANEITEKYISEEKLKESYQQIRRLSEHLHNIREQERLHISREIHDELGQLLTVLKMDISWLYKKAETSTDAVKSKFKETLDVIDTTVKTVRRIAAELRPSLLDELGLVAAIEWQLEEFEKRSGIKKEFSGPEKELILSDSQKIGIFRILQESLTNVARHSQATLVKVKLEEKDNQIILQITDNGKGFDPEQTARTKKTLGVLGMRERTEMMGGTYSITSAPGGGATVQATIPKTSQEPVQ